MKIELVKACAAREGSAVMLVFSLSVGDNSEETKLYISAEDYARAGRPAPGEIYSESGFDEMCALSQAYEAENKAMYLLSFGDCSRRALVRKLTARGIGREAAADAAQALSEKGLINEDAQLDRKIHDCAENKLWGKRRIVQFLMSKGFDRDGINSAMEKAVETIDFEKQKKLLIRRSFGAGYAPQSYEEKAKLRAFLYRYGY